MKYSAIAFITLMSISGFAGAKSYVSGDIKSIDRDNLEISIIKSGGAVKEYKVEPALINKMRSLKKGDNVTLTLETAKLDK